MVNATRPDVEQLIVGGQTRKRSRTRAQAGGAALAVVLLGGGVFGVTQLDRDDAGSTDPTGQPTKAESAGTTTPPTLDDNPTSDVLEPGTYRVLVGDEVASGEIEADLTFTGTGWAAGNFPIVQDAESVGGLGVYRPDALAAESGCTGDLVTTNLGESTFALAVQLAKLPESTLVQPVKPTLLLGQDAYHLRLRIPQTCPIGQAYRPAETPRGGRGITYERPDETLPPVIMDFWVLEKAGVPVVVDSWHQEGAAADLLEQISQARESITFVSSE